MGKAVINTCYGGFGISEEAYNWLKIHSIEGTKYNYIDDKLLYKCEYDDHSIRCHYYGPRHHPLFIKCVEELGEKASDTFANLQVVEFEGNLYRITEYDGYESIETPNDLIWSDCNEY